MKEMQQVSVPQLIRRLTATARRIRGSAEFRNAAVLLAVWIAVPAVLRLATLASLLPRFNTLGEGLAVVAYGFLLSIPQDLFIAVEALALLATIQFVLTRCLPKHAEVLTALAAAGLFAVVQFYVLFDFLLFAKTGIRMDYAFLGFLPSAGSFASSAWEIGILPLIVGVVILVVSLRKVFQVTRQHQQVLHTYWPWTAAALLMFLPAWYSAQAVPAEIGYAVNHVVLSDQAKWAASWKSDNSRHDEEFALNLVRPQAESYELVDARFPLLKETHGFHGPRQFELRVDPGERPHMVMLFLESFRAADIGVLGARHGASPNFDRLSEQGVLFSEFYGNGVQTTRAVVASLFGILPVASMKSAQASASEMPLIGMADLLKSRGYHSAYITGSSLTFENKLPFFLAHGYDEVLGQDHLAERYPQAPRTSWGFHDEYLVDYVTDWLVAQDRQNQPAFLTTFTISHHHPWHVPDGYHAPQFDVDQADEYARFLQTFHYTDHCLGRFFQRLEETGLADKTIVFVLADTGSPMGEHQENYMLVNQLYEENVRIPLLIMAPGRIAEPRKLDCVASQVDLLPTLLDILSLPGLNHAVGTSLMREVPDRTAYFNNPFAMQFRGLRHGDDKYLHILRSGQQELFDVIRDPGELHNVAAEFPAQVQQFDRQTSAVEHLFLRLHMARAFADAEWVQQARAGVTSTEAATADAP